MGGIRLPQSNISPLNLSTCKDPRVISTTIAAQLLSLLDAFIFPSDNKKLGKTYGMALVRATDSRIGQSQGPLLASLIRLSVLLLTHLEPCSLRFLHACGRLRTFSRWLLSLIRENGAAIGGINTPFTEATAYLDRLALVIVLHAHRALEKCARLLTIFERNEKLFQRPEDRKKTSRRVMKAAHELREILSQMAKDQGELLRTSLAPRAREDLIAALWPGGGENDGTEIILRKFLNSTWVRRWHDVKTTKDGDLLPEMVSNGQVHEGSVSGVAGRKAIGDLVDEGRQIMKDYDQALNGSFEEYRENQKNWADTDKVRDLEDDGDRVIDRFMILKRQREAHLSQGDKRRLALGKSLYKKVEAVLSAPWSFWSTEKARGHWVLSHFTDRLHRSILLEPNPNFEDHKKASYQGGLERDKDRSERERRERQEEMVRKAALKAGGVQEEVEDEEGEGDEGAEGDQVDDSIVEDEEDEEEEEEDDSEFYMIQEDESKDEHSWAKQNFVWERREKVVMFCEVINVTPSQSVRGNLLLTTHNIYFHPEKILGRQVGDAEEPALGSQGDEKDCRWQLNRIVKVYGRRYILRPQAVEVFFCDTHEIFLSFEGGSKIRDRFWSKLRAQKCPMLSHIGRQTLSPRAAFLKSKATDLWKRRKMSNFEYIMRLNMFAGRSFNDITQYPVFPWVLKDYNSEKIDLTDERVYRDLSKPIGALNEVRLNQLLERFNDMDGFDENFRFLYGSHYSSPGIVLHFLLRQEPFTSMAIDLQGGRFDCPDRLFFDLSSSWNCCQTNSGDFKELIPELFFCPEVLMNTNDFPLGELQDKRGKVDDVRLPKWAKGSPHEFIRIQREALESEYVSNNLHAWIDLIFGYKQKGDEAIKANNLFHRLSYEGAVDLDKIEDSMERKGAEAHIMNFGQTPAQLMTRRDGRHPKRQLDTECWSTFCCTHERLKNLKSYIPAKQYGMNGERGRVAAINLHGETCRVVYEDMTVGIYSFSTTDSTGFPFSLKMKESSEISHRGYRRGRSGRRAAFGFIVTCAGSTGGEGEDKDGDEIEDVVACAAGFWDRELKICKVQGKKKALLESTNGGHTGEISALVNDGPFVITGGVDSTIRVYIYKNDLLADALSGVKREVGEDGELRQVHVLWGHTGEVRSIDLCTVSDVIVSGDDQGVVCVNALRRGHFIRLLDAGEGKAGVKCVKVGQYGEFVVLLDDNTMSVFTVNGAKLCSTTDVDVNCIELSTDSKYVIGGGDGFVKFWRMNDLSVAREVEVAGDVSCILCTPADNSVDQYMLVGFESGAMAIMTDPKHRLHCLNQQLHSLPWFDT